VREEFYARNLSIFETRFVQMMQANQMNRGYKNLFHL